jgi:hypothetical protein
VSVRGAKELMLSRDFALGKNGQILFGVETYPQLKRVFDEIHRRDDHTISLKEAVTAEAK